MELRSVCKSAHQLDSTAHQLNEPDCKMVVLGVVKQSAVSFDLLEPAPACWCASFSVPSVTGKVLSGQTALGHLKESGRREHSHQYQNLCLWLAANGLLLVCLRDMLCTCCVHAVYMLCTCGCDCVHVACMYIHVHTYVPHACYMYIIMCHMHVTCTYVPHACYMYICATCMLHVHMCHMHVTCTYVPHAC